MKKDPDIFIGHILEGITAIEEYLNGVSKNDFLKQQQVQDAVIRRLERDILIHQYFGIDLELVWSTVQNDLPKLKRALQQKGD